MKKIPGQVAFNFDPEPLPYKEGDVIDLPGSFLDGLKLQAGGAEALNRQAHSFRRMTDLESYIEQIARDKETLTMDPVFHVPSREFYKERIRMFQEAARMLCV